MTHPQPGRLKRRLIIAGTILLLLGAMYLWLRYHYQGIIKEKLPQLSLNATDSTYKVETGDVMIDVPGGRAVFTNLRLAPNPAQMAKLRNELRLPSVRYQIQIARLEITGIAWSRLAADKLLDCTQIRVVSPVIRIVRLSKELAEDTSGQPKESQFQSVLAKMVTVENPDIVFIDSSAAEAVSYQLKGGSVHLSDWDFDINRPPDTTKLLYAGRVDMEFGSFAIKNERGIYGISSGAIKASTADNTFSVADLRVRPLVSAEEFYRRTGFQKEIYKLHVPGFRLDGVNWNRLLQEGAIVAKEGTISDAAIDIYMSRVPPPNPYSKNGKFPHQMLMKLKLPLDVPLLNVRNGRFTYTEKNHKSEREGTVAMQSINGQIRNLSNVAVRVRRSSFCTISLQGNFKGSRIDALFRFDLNSSKGAFSVAGSLGPMDGTRLNDITKPLALAELNKLAIDGVTFNIQGSEAGAKGDLVFRYHDLKVTLLKPDDGNLEDHEFTSLLANALLTHDRNPSRGTTRKVHPEVVRDDKKSFFNLIWKTIFTGTLQTASRKLIKLDKVVNNRMERQEEKRLEEEPPKPAKKR